MDVTDKGGLLPTLKIVMQPGAFCGHATEIIDDLKMVEQSINYDKCWQVGPSLHQRRFVKSSNAGTGSDYEYSIFRVHNRFFK